MLPAPIRILGAVAALVALGHAEEDAPCKSRTKCVDMVNKCGLKFGGCYDECKTPTPTWTTPACPTTTSKWTTSTRKPSSADNCSTRTVCADYVNACGQWYGGCFADCRPWPTFTPPPCTKTTKVPVPTDPNPVTRITTESVTFKTKLPTSISIITPPPKPSDCKQRTVCVDYINACGQTYGGCFPDCKPWPTFTPPACTKTATKP